MGYWARGRVSCRLILVGGVLYVLGSLPALSKAVMSAKESPTEHAEAAVGGAGDTKGREYEP